MTFSIRVSNRNSGRSCRNDNSISTVCCNSDPSCPVTPGGASLIFEWSLQGGAAVESMIILGNKWPLIFSASSFGSTSQMFPMCVWFMSNVSLKIDMHVSSVSHQNVCRTVRFSFCNAKVEIPMPVKKERCSMGDVLCRILCSNANVLGWSAIGVAAISVLCCPYLFLPWPLYPLRWLLYLPFCLPFPFSLL